MALKNYEKTFEIFEKEGLNENDVDERWLLVFMIGKIKEKQGHPLLSSLECYQKSIGYLRKNKVFIPRKIDKEAQERVRINQGMIRRIVQIRMNLWKRRQRTIVNA